MARNNPPMRQPERNQPRGTGLHTPRSSESPEKPRKRLSSRSRIALIIAGVWVLFAGGIVFSYWLSDLPDTRNLLAYDREQTDIDEVYASVQTRVADLLAFADQIERFIGADTAV